MSLTSSVGILPQDIVTEFVDCPVGVQCDCPKYKTHTDQAIWTQRYYLFKLLLLTHKNTTHIRTC